MATIKRSIEGELFHEIEDLGNKKYEHIGFIDKENKFGDMIASLVPKVGMKKEARLTIQIFDEKEGQNGKDKSK